jgi:hypothetical protein
MKLIQHFGELGAVVWVREASFFDAWKDDCWIGKFATLNQALYALLAEFEGPDGRVAFVPEGAVGHECWFLDQILPCRLCL